MESTKRRWKDRDGKAWDIDWNPPVELDTRSVQGTREGLFFRREGEEHHAPAPYGSDVDTLTRADLQGLLDKARREG